MKKDILSSYALFSKLKDEGKSIYDVIKVFIAAYLQESKKYEFSLSEITFGINTDFNFKLPAAVIRKALVKMKGISHSNDEKYSVDYSSLANINVSEIKKLEDSINKVLLSLRLYIENKNNKEQNEQEKNNLNDDFLKYLMYSSCSEINMKYISAFLLENENDSLIVEMINAIKEGAIIYTGITTDLNIDDNNIDNLGIWRKEITIFLDTEILFHLYGYNGEYYKQQADDFISLVKEINRNRKFVYLKYFLKVKEEIYAFFKAAESIVSKGFLNENTVAMSAIVKGCAFPSDVIEKRTLFFDFLKQYSIEEDLNDSYYSDETNFKYNIEDSKEEVHPYLNFINILRKGRNSGKLTDIGCILLTGKSSILKQSWEKRNNKDIPRASNLEYMTEHFWFILNKGFGTNTKLKSFDVIAKAKIIMSSLLSSNISEKYADINRRFDSGELLLDDAVKYLTALREETKLPEEIKKDNVNYILNMLSEDDISKQIEENAIKENELQKIISESLSKDELLKQKEIELKEKDNELKRFKEMERTREEKRLKRKRRIKRSLFFLLFILSLVFIYIYFKYLNKSVTTFFQKLYKTNGDDIGKIIGYIGFFGINVPSMVSLVKKIFNKLKKRKKC